MLGRRRKSQPKFILNLWELKKARFFSIRIDTAQKMKFYIKYLFSKCDQIHWKVRIWSHLLKKFLMKIFVFVHYALLKSVGT